MDERIGGLPPLEVDGDGNVRLAIKLIFDDWRLSGKSIYSTEEGVALSSGDLHSGSTFDGEIILSQDAAEDLSNASLNGRYPVFSVIRKGV